MTQTFVHIDYPTRHSGVERMERVIDGARSLRKGWDSCRGLAAVLLASMVSAVVVVAEQLIETWADGHLFAAWVLLWVVGFAALALLANPARLVARRIVAGLDQWSQRVARERADARLWALARRDARVMADLQAARSRSEG